MSKEQGGTATLPRASPGHCTSPDVLPSHVPAIEMLELPPAVSCRDAGEQCTSSFHPAKQGKKGTFKYCNCKFAEFFFLQKIRDNVLLLPIIGVNEVSPLSSSPPWSPRSDALPLGTCVHLSCSWSLAQWLTPNGDFSMGPVATWPAQRGPH